MARRRMIYVVFMVLACSVPAIAQSGFATGEIRGNPLNNTVGNIAPPFRVKGRRDLGPSRPLGFTSAFEPRRIQLGARVNF